MRVHVGERALTTWLVLDVSASMAFGTADRRKADVAEGVALAVGHVATRRGNRLGVLAFGGGGAAHPAPAPGPPGPARAARRAAPRERGRRRRRDLARLRAGQRRGARPPARARRDRLRLPRRARLGGAAARPARPPRRDGGRDRRPARAGARLRRRPLARRPRDRPPGPRRHAPAQDPRPLRGRRGASAPRSAARCSRAGADHVELSTGGDWLRIFASHLRRSEAALRAGAPARAAVRNRIQAGTARHELRRTDPARRVHPRPARDARLRVAAAAPAARVGGVGQPRARPRPDADAARLAAPPAAAAAAARAVRR